MPFVSASSWSSSFSLILPGILRLQVIFSHCDCAVLLQMSDIEDASSAGEGEVEVGECLDEDHCHLCGQKYGDLDRDPWQQHTHKTLAPRTVQKVARSSLPGSRTTATTAQRASIALVGAFLARKPVRSGKVARIIPRLRRSLLDSSDS